MRSLFSLLLAQGDSNIGLSIAQKLRDNTFLVCRTGHPNTSWENTPGRSGLGERRGGAEAARTPRLSPDGSIWRRRLFQAVAEMQPLGQDSMFSMQPQGSPQECVSNCTAQRSSPKRLP